MAATLSWIDDLARALSLYEGGALSAARALCAAILDATPDQAETMLLAGIIDAGEGRDAAAARLFRRCIALTPQSADAYANLGGLIAAGRAGGDALATLDRAITLAPANADAWINRGLAHVAGRRWQAALADYSRALGIAPESASALAGIGRVLRELGRPRDALAVHRRAILLAPGSAIAWQDAGHSARAIDPEVAAVAYARASRIAPDDGRMASDLFFQRRLICDWRKDATDSARLRAMIDDDTATVLPLAKLLIDLDPARQDRAARCFARDVLGMAIPWQPPAAPVDPERPLTIAYLSADFHEHATAYLAAELFERHDPARFRTIAYSFGSDDDSPMRRRLRAAFALFREVGDIDADRLSTIARADGVDILVDLKGYTERARIDLLRRRIAPVQVGWLGYPGTLGTATLDYVIGDGIVTPAAHQRHFAEAIVRLPDCYQPNDRRRPLPAAPPDRAAAGLPRDGFLFGALHASQKIGPASFAGWMRILRAVPGSVLWLRAPPGDGAIRLRAAATADGIDPARLVFAPSLPQAAHIARLAAADLMLDSFPYTGHTTTSDALWAGVPVVTRIGTGFAARVAASLLYTAGLGDLVASSAEEQERLAIELARSPDSLAALRRRLVDQRDRGPLFDAEVFARHLESAYRLMWRRHAAAVPPAPIEVPKAPG